MGGVTRALVEGSPALGSTTPAQTGLGVAAAVILNANPKRKGFTVQNTGTTVIKLTLGATDPTQTEYHVALKACSAADDGSGGTYFDDSWVGVVRGISSGAGGTCVVSEYQSGSPNWDVAYDWGLR